MAFHKSICFLIIFITFMSCSHAHTFKVGGKDGWTLHPSENYTSWSGRLRFLINDTLHFKYGDGSDSVLVVNKSDYDGCNGNNPIKKLDGGDSLFKFDRSGPFYFITGNKSNCDQGQKLSVVVLAFRKPSTPPSIATPPSSSAVPPSPVVSPVVPPSTSPVSPPSTAVSPVSPPSISPVSPPSMSPVSPPSTAVSPVLPPSMSPISPPPTAGSPELSPSGTPIFSPPAPSPGGGSAESPGGGSASAPGGGGGLSPEGSPGANSNTSSSTATPPLFGISVASLVTVTFGLWGLI